MLEKKTISDYVYEQILGDIVQLRYAPGEKISETQLAAVLEVSRAPIKSALAKLEKEGFVKIKPQYGTFVSEISVERAEGICDIREILEAQAVRRAVRNITDEQLEYLEKQFARMDALQDDDEGKRQFIYEVDGMLQRYMPEIQRIQRANMTWADRKEPTQAEMRRILKALKERDEEQAVAAMKEHISNIRETIKKL